MTWSISVGASNKAELKKAAAEAVVSGTASQPAHDADRVAIIENIGRVIDAMPEPHARDETINVSAYGSVITGQNLRPHEIAMNVRVFLR